MKLRGSVAVSESPRRAAGSGRRGGRAPWHCNTSRRRSAVADADAVSVCAPLAAGGAAEAAGAASAGTDAARNTTAECAGNTDNDEAEEAEDDETNIFPR